MKVGKEAKRRVAALGIVLILAALVPLPSLGQGGRREPHQGIVITLKNSFIDEYKDRVTIEATYTVDKAHPHPNPPAQDGDLHVAGRSPQIGLATVAEIMNAQAQTKAVDRIHQVQGTGKAVKLTGAWRLWCEHGGTRPQVQGAALQPFTTTNPDHVFELHPITQIDDLSLLPSLMPIKGFKTKDAHDAFVNYENLTCEIKPEDTKTTLITHMAGYNYVEFILELNEKPQELTDGTAALCAVRDLEGELLVRERRMVFLKDSAPEQKVKGLDKGNRLHVLGIPRIDLALVDWRVKHQDDPRKPLTWNLPYEIIVVAAYPQAEVND
jgi:hypothetical protein